jgi:hypothetical protein
MSLNPDGTLRSLGGFMEINSVISGNLGRSRADERNFRYALRVSF